MNLRLALAATLVGLGALNPLPGQGRPDGTVGWYNGDWQPGIPGLGNFVSDQQSARVYDDFVVPAGGWTIASVFSHNSMSVEGVKEAAWEIRSGVAEGNGGTVIVSGRSAASQTYALPVGGGQSVYRIRVDGLNIPLPPGRYWLNVAPVAGAGQSFVCATKGVNAAGDPPGNNGLSFNTAFHQIESSGQGGTSGDFSQGVLIAPGAAPVPPGDLWRSDVAWLAQELPARHFRPFGSISAEDFAAAAAAIQASLPDATDAQIRTGIQALVASIEDPHTDVGWGSPAPFRYLPITLYWFPDGFHVIQAAPAYRGLLGGRVTSIGGAGIDDAANRLTALIPHENDAWVRANLPDKLINTDFLFGTGVAESVDGAPVTVELPAGETVSAEVAALAPSQMPAQVTFYQGDLPLYRQHPERFYWATLTDGGRTVYFQYNSCTEDPRQPFASFRNDLDALTATPGVGRVVVDMRNNTGGVTSYLNPWITDLIASRFNRNGRLFVIVGRRTFSAAMALSDRFREQTAATFAGEPSGGKPRFYTRAGDFPLPYFGIRVSYSNGVYPAVDDGDTIHPDIPLELTFEDYANGRDPFLDAILRLPIPQ